MEVLKAGDKIEGFKILDELGRGAASVIYLVQDPKSKQIFALKEVKKHTDKDQRFLDQTESEYKVSQALDHPAFRKIPKLIKVGKFLNVKGIVLLMELVDGESLDKTPPSTFEAAVSIFHQVAEGLAHMHDRGYVHADMKPNNIVVDDAEHVKIIDLGQSCKIGTIKPRIQGTPDYIAPEQVHRRAITGQTDIYNLGATMYWVLTRQNIPTALAGDQSLIGSLDDDFIEKAKPVNELNPRVNSRLNDLIMACIHVNPVDRPENMHGVADTLNLIHGIIVAAAEKKAASRDAAATDED